MSNCQTEKITHIYPNHKLLDIDFRSLWEYRDLFLMYIQRDIVTYYKQTVFGPLWYFLQPVLTTVMYMFVFGTLAHIPTDGIPAPLFYLAGIALWNYWSQSFQSCSNVFGKNAYVFGKVWFPRLVVPLSHCTSGLIRFGIQILIFIFAYMYYALSGQIEVHINAAVLAVPLIVFVAGAQAMAFGLISSSLTVKYKDLILVMQFLVQLVMFATPVIYPLSFAPERYRWLMNLNPLTPLFETFKYCLLGVGTFDAGSVIYSLVFLLVSLVISILIFQKAEKRFIDTI